ncbi:FG-GAP repeat domain-containing protein [Silicimonas algicola]|uniref:VCBS repeat protein n=1 Tax=Silicimonas algicola TaxID=1826607 RepID=A0A316GDH4_9RHOB|nr:VCBS repeat-containing protein [Silicimonas algicola]PWK58623.1 VCBS repeat protein [Silicimonas algicola]
MTLALCAGAAGAEEIESARYDGPVTHYDHGILGDAVEYSELVVKTDRGRAFRVRLPEGGRVFEDTMPRLWDVTGDGAPEVVVVETDPPRGAQLAIYGMTGGRLAKIAATPHIGATHRWLAPVGAADLDGDGTIEVAFVDRPHLAKVLRVWRFGGGTFREVASLEGATNHRIGWDFIPGGVRTCGAAPEIIVASGDWTRLLALRFDGRNLSSRTLGPYRDPSSLDAALTCP